MVNRAEQVGGSSSTSRRPAPLERLAKRSLLLVVNGAPIYAAANVHDRQAACGMAVCQFSRFDAHLYHNQVYVSVSRSTRFTLFIL